MKAHKQQLAFGQGLSVEKGELAMEAHMDTKACKVRGFPEYDACTAAPRRSGRAAHAVRLSPPPGLGLAPAKCYRAAGRMLVSAGCPSGVAQSGARLQQRWEREGGAGSALTTGARCSNGEPRLPAGARSTSRTRWALPRTAALPCTVASSSRPRCTRPRWTLPSR